MDGVTLAKVATIAWGAMGGGPPEEEEVPPAPAPALAPVPAQPASGNGQQPPKSEEKELLTGEKQFDINNIQRLLNQGDSNGS